MHSPLDRWIVAERDVTVGVSEDGEMYTMTYAANVPIDTQAGSFHGTLEMDSLVFKVRGKIQPLETPPQYGGLPMLTIGGSWILEGTQGNGTFSGYVVFWPDNGHVGEIVLSEFTMEGKWKQ